MQPEVSVLRTNPETESESLSAMWKAVVPREIPIESKTWLDTNLESYWLVVRGQKVGMLAIELDRAPAHCIEDDSLPSRGSIYLMIIGLIPDYRRLGLGTKVMEWLTAASQRRSGYTKILSNIRASNDASMKLHRKSGFRVIERRECYYPNPIEDAIVLECKL